MPICHRPHPPPRVQQTVSAVDQSPELTLSDVISRSNLPLNRLEDIAFGVMFRRKSAELGATVGVPVHTGGRPTHISETLMASVGSSTASRWTLARRADVIQQIEKHVAGAKDGDSAAQHSFAPGRASQEERQALPVEAKAVRHTVSVDDAVALALHLRLSNDQLRKLR